MGISPKIFEDTLYSAPLIPCLLLFVCLSYGLRRKSGGLTRSDLNALIYDYLVIEGFSDAAVEFARETGLPSEVDEASIRERMEIREAVEEGRVEEAVKRVNELDPEVS